jgi:hypothetical protein
MISPSAAGIERIGPDRMAQTATFRKFQYNGSAIKKQDGGSPDLTRVGRMREIEMRPSKRSFSSTRTNQGEQHAFILLIASAILAFAATMTIETTDANAVVCGRGVYRAGCAGYRGAVAACRRVLVNGAWVRRCV